MESPRLSARFEVNGFVLCRSPGEILGWHRRGPVTPDYVAYNPVLGPNVGNNVGILRSM